MAKQDDYTRYTIRIPTPLYERVKTAAGDKSVNAEIIDTLEAKYPAPVQSDPEELIGLRHYEAYLVKELKGTIAARDLSYSNKLQRGLKYVRERIEQLSPTPDDD